MRFAPRVRRAVDGGITFFDTARGYADSEEKIGAALRGIRERAVVATKAQALDRRGMAEAVEASLKALATDYIDLYQFHNIAERQALEKGLSAGGALEALQAARERGKIRHIGITSHSARLLKTIASSQRPQPFETMQAPLNFVGDESGRELLPLALKADMGFIAMKPLGGGVLERPDLALRYVLQFEGAVIIPGMSAEAELEQNLALAERCEPLTAAELSELVRLKAELGGQFCRKCDYCRPCPQGVQISLVLAASSFFKRFSTEMLAGWCRGIMRGALQCKDCGACEKKCPYRLPVRRLLKENIALFKRKAEELGIPWE